MKSAFDEFTSERWLASVSIRLQTSQTLPCNDGGVIVGDKNNERRFSRIMLEFFSLFVCDRSPFRQVLECRPPSPEAAAALVIAFLSPT